MRLIRGWPKRRLVVTSCAALVVAVSAILLLGHNHQPVYMGHSLSYWVRVLGAWNAGNDLVDLKEHDAAEAAIRLADSNAVPYLVKWFEDEGKDPISRTTSRLLLSINTSWYLSYAPVIRSAGAGQALPLLGPEAKSAIPELTRIMNDPSNSTLAQRAIMILPHLGPEAVPPLAATLTNQYPYRLLVVNCIPPLGTNARPLIPELIQLLGDKDELLASMAATALGQLKLEPALVLPSLTNRLEDPRSWLRLAAARTILLNFTNPPDTARTALLTLLSDPDEHVRGAATNALRKAGISFANPQ